MCKRTNCIADSKDGAANVSGIYNALRAKTKENVPNHVYIRCDAHALNPVLYDSYTSIPAFSLYGLVKKLVISFRDSYKHMNAWRDMIVKCQIRRNRRSANDKQHQMIKQVSCFNAHFRFISRSRLICLPSYNPLFNVHTRPTFKQSKPIHKN